MYVGSLLCWVKAPCCRRERQNCGCALQSLLKSWSQDRGCPVLLAQPPKREHTYIFYHPKVTGSSGSSGFPLSWSDIPCVQRWRKGVLKHKRGILNLIPHLKEKLTCGNEHQHYPALEGSEGKQRCVWDVSLTEGGNLGSSVSSQFFRLTGQTGQINCCVPSLPGHGGIAMWSSWIMKISMMKSNIFDKIFPHIPSKCNDKFSLPMLVRARDATAPEWEEITESVENKLILF